MNDLIREAQKLTDLEVPSDATTYEEPKDYAGLGYNHRMVSWIDSNGFPRSVVIPIDG